jgi:2-(1,2-epoxy-1,2-dihydrophenyl)acetyl-CoA isomerase
MAVTRTLDAGVATVLIDRPAVRNAIDVETVSELAAAVAEMHAAGARALVLGGKGGFCAGADLALVRQAFEGDPAPVLGALVDNLHAFIRQLWAMPIPSVAALEGPAVGAGMGLALSTDLRVAGRSAVLIPGYFGIGSSPDGGVSYFLTRALGAARATALLVRNRPLDAATLAELGLVEDVVEDGTAVAAAQELAAELAGVPPLALVRTRGLVDRATVQDLDTHLDDERGRVAENWAARDFKEGVAAFLERRRPIFTGS